MAAWNLDELAGPAIETSVGRGLRLAVLIDGRSGAGKTILAQNLSARLEAELARPVQTVSLDDCYPGWRGLAAGAAAVPRMLASLAPGYRRYDWAKSCLTDWVELDAKLPIVIEGSGALTPKSAPLATMRIWMDGAESWRRQAAASRDGDVDGWWDDWAAQEQAHILADKPNALCDCTLTAASDGLAFRFGPPAPSVMKWRWLHEPAK